MLAESRRFPKSHLFSFVFLFGFFFRDKDRHHAHARNSTSHTHFFLTLFPCSQRYCSVDESAASDGSSVSSLCDRENSRRFRSGVSASGGSTRMPLLLSCSRRSDTSAPIPAGNLNRNKTPLNRCTAATSLFCLSIDTTILPL